MTNIYKEPISGVPIMEPLVLPEQGDVLLGYELYDKKGLITPPHIEKMNTRGWISVLICAIVFFPVMCLPCCMGCSYSMYQCPVYGKEKKE